MPPKIIMIREIIGGPARIKFDNATYKRAGDVAVKSIIQENIIGQKQADGGSLKKNKPSTVRQKRRKGRPPLSLIDTRERFVKLSSWVVRVIKGGVVFHPKDLKVTEAVQRKGYTGWFALGRRGKLAVKQVFVEAIEKARKKAAAKRKKQVIAK